MANITLHTNSPLHFLLLPYPGQGHINPMLALAQNLEAHGCTVTCVLPEHTRRAIVDFSGPSEPHHGLQYAIFPGDFSSISKENFAGTLMAVQQQQGFLENLIENSKTTDSPIDCIIADYTFAWTQDVANKSGIPRAIFWLCSAAVFHMGCVAKEGGIYPGAPQLQELQERLHISANAMLELFDSKDQAVRDRVSSFYNRLEEPSHILINTFEALEGHILPLLPSKVRFIGPCFPPSDMINFCGSYADQHDQPHHHQPTARLGSLAEENMDCLDWLDKQEDCSVLYISFGSVASLPHATLVEMALGIEASRYKFLWVARADTDAGTSFPEGFQERTQDRGKVIPWAPQLKVLNHRAVGGFLTHCGWNSTLESICMGVPMLCFPFFADQPINEDSIKAGAQHMLAQGEHKEGTTTALGLGFEGRRNQGGVKREEVENVVKTLMGNGQVGVQLRENARQLRDHAKSTLNHHTGSSHVTLLSFIKDIRNLKK